MKNSEYEINRIFDQLEIKIPDNINNKITQPSFTTDKIESFNMLSQLSKWKKVLSNKQIDNILNITNKFGVDFYGNDFEPDYSKIYNAK